MLRNSLLQKNLRLLGFFISSFVFRVSVMRVGMFYRPRGWKSTPQIEKKLVPKKHCCFLVDFSRIPPERIVGLASVGYNQYPRYKRQWEDGKAALRDLNIESSLKMEPRKR